MARWFIAASLVLLGWPAAPASAQSPAFHGPISGFLYNRAAGTVTPLLGVPGSASIGSPVLSNIDFASISPGGDCAFTTQTGRSFFMCGLAALTPAESASSGLIDSVDRVIWNRGGSVALLYSSATNQLQRVSLSGSGPSADQPLDLSPWGQPTALAIDPAGRQIAFGIAQSGIYLFAAGQSPVLISAIGQPAAAAFDGAGNLYAIDLEQQQILKIDSGANVSTLASVAQPNAPAVSPAGLAVSADNHYLALADSAAQAVSVYDTSSGAMTTTLPLDFPPTRFAALSTGPTFLLNGDNPNEWLLVLDARQFPRLFFVPANQEAAQ